MKAKLPFRLAALNAALAGLAGLALPLQAAAQTAQNGTAEQLERVVVSASASARPLVDAPASVTIVTREQLEREPIGSLQDALRRVEGVAVVGSGANDMDISLRGMPGEYSLILVDGVRQSTRETMNRSTGGVQAFWMPPLAAIERIEIVRGPMSALYGADAMGGVINIITRKQITTWSGAVNLGATWQQGDERQGDSRQGDFWLGGPLAAGLSAQLWGALNQRDEDKIYYPISLTSGLGEQRNQNLGAKLGFSPSASQQFALELGRAELSREARPGVSLAASAAVNETVQTRDYWLLSHSARIGEGGGTRWRSSLLQERGEQQVTDAGVSTGIEPRITNTVLDSLLSLPLGAHSLSLGLQVQRSELDGVANESVVKGHVGSPNQLNSSASALFAEDEIEISEAFALTLGLRMDHDQNFGTHWSPRAYGIYKLAGGVSLRGGMGSGFKAPKLRQAEAGYCMSTGGNSPRRGSLCGNPDLQPETSRSVEIGTRWDGASNSYLAATLFHNDFRNKVVSYNSGKVDPLNKALDIYVYDNVDEVKLQGLELAGAFTLSPAWSVAGNYTYTDSQRQGGKETSFSGASLDGKPLDKAPEHMASARLDWHGPAGLQGFLRLNHEGEQRWAALRNGAKDVRERGALNTLDLGVSYKFNPHLNLSAAVLNLTNRQLAIDERSRNTGLSGNWQIDEGRRVWLRMGAQF